MKTVLGDLQIVVERHSDVLRNNALPFRVLIVLRILGFALSLVAAAYGFLSLRPFQLFSVEVWRLFTCNFVGRNVLLFAWTIWSLHFGTNLIRQNNSNESLLKIYAITQILTTVLVCGAAYGLYALAAKTTLLYEDYIVEMVPINCAVLVLIKQFLPDSILLETPFGRIKYTHVPLLAVLSVSICSLAGVMSSISWTYLRFFNPHEVDSFYGDSSEHFVWARSLVKLGVCKRSVRHVDLNSLQSVGISLRGLDSTARDAERRRQKALRDLNERLHKTKKMETIAWEEDAEDEREASTEPEAKQSGKQADNEKQTDEPEMMTSTQPSESVESHK
ncbi:hypothetical protein ANCDUO_10371 [Ancylostoma duodenale]|uniref:Uncharacterized protein n=1 Tax=Ancylostoma duodenale TaxID=51022 RepID=A0A0C2GKL8_9BILA|nr:hypothetical protein ANCDUO_10371 [Ancylostoma duodenale]